jgi:MFS family permease
MPERGGVDTVYSWVRLLATVLLSAIGCVGLWSVVVVLPSVQREFEAARGGASLPYTLLTVCAAAGSVPMGRLSDRRGIATPTVIGIAGLTLGYIACSYVTSLWQFILIHGVLIGFLGTSTAFGPLIADASCWFAKRRGLAVSLAATGSYIAGAIWPEVVQHGVDTWGWRQTHFAIGVFCCVAMLPLVLFLRRPRPLVPVDGASGSHAGVPQAGLGLSPQTLQVLLVLAALSCCVAMSMPQVHLVAYCGDLGYGAARGADMLSIMLACGIVSRIGSGFISDRIGGLRTLLLGSVMQGVALLLYTFFDGLVSLYVISALFGLFQGGIVPSYALIVREYFPAREAGTRVSIALTASMLGMALGGWMSGVIFDISGSYRMAFLNGTLWNLLNASIVVFLLMRARRPLSPSLQSAG